MQRKPRAAHKAMPEATLDTIQLAKRAEGLANAHHKKGKPVDGEDEIERTMRRARADRPSERDTDPRRKPRPFIRGWRTNTVLFLPVLTHPTGHAGKALRDSCV